VDARRVVPAFVPAGGRFRRDRDQVCTSFIRTGADEPSGEKSPPEKNEPFSKLERVSLRERERERERGRGERSG
jgi:hypothetical protein